MFNKFKDLKNEDGAGALGTVLLVALGVIVGIIAVKFFFAVIALALKALFLGVFILGVVILVIGIKSALKNRKSAKRCAVLFAHDV